MAFPPGILYILKLLPGFLQPPLATWALAWLLQRYMAIHISPSFLAVLCVLSVPLVFTAKAAAQGAVLPPVVASSAGGITLVRRVLKSATEDFPGELQALFNKEYGRTLHFRILFEDKIILSTQFDNFEKGEDIQGILRPIAGLGILAAEGESRELWKFHRTLLRPFFKRERSNDFGIMDRHALVAVEQLEARLAEGHPVDFQVDLVWRFLMDSSAEFLFGYEANTLTVGLPFPSNSSSSSSVSPQKTTSPFVQFAQAQALAQRIVFLRGVVGNVWPLLGKFWVDTVRAPARFVQEFLDPILATAAAKRGKQLDRVDANGSEREVQEGETLVDHLLNTIDGVCIFLVLLGKDSDDEVPAADKALLRDSILNVSVAARDPTSSLLTFALYMLIQHPDVMVKLRQEIEEVVGPTRAPAADDFKRMSFLRAVLNETLRLYPPAPFNVRTTINPITLPAPTPGDKPFYIPAKSWVTWSTMFMHRSTDLWGPDALEWDPERFIDERLHKYLTPNPFIFLPFNAGPRGCLGQEFAYHQASFCLAQEALKPLPASWTDKQKDELGWKSREKVVVRNHLTLYVEGGLWIRMREGGDPSVHLPNRESA
ncbi:cytochrome P450 [Roridomyces roridus]|uniref:Cytochrome P450 n=1 Tax=Roridomyces roridus TaxID=1738132 RepID=A0AAD7BAB4_9AGAR|nr:cytochrome P450 [Roridomyces roridus]